MATTKTTQKVILSGFISFKGAKDGDVYNIKQCDETGLFYVISEMGIDTRDGGANFKTLNAAILYCNNAIKNSEY